MGRSKICTQSVNNYDKFQIWDCFFGFLFWPSLTGFNGFIKIIMDDIIAFRKHSQCSVGIRCVIGLIRALGVSLGSKPHW